MVAPTSITIFPNGSRFAVEPGGRTQVESYSSMMQGPALGPQRSERLIIAVSHQPRAEPLAGRVHRSIMWAKLKYFAEGAAITSTLLWH